MLHITRITEVRKRPNWRRIHLDGAPSFKCTKNIVARFGLTEGMTLNDEQLQKLGQARERQRCFDKATTLLGTRRHSQAELIRKLARNDYAPDMVKEVVADLIRLGYVDDEEFARTKAQSAAQHKKHGRQRVMEDLLRAGVKEATAAKALDGVFDPSEGSIDDLETARQLAEKKAPSLRRLDPMVAHRRLAGMLQRRGFDYEMVKPIIDEVLGSRETD